MNNKIFIGLVVLAAGVLAGWYFLKGNAAPDNKNQTVEVSPTPSGSNLGAPEQATGAGTAGMDKGGVATRTVVTYSNAGFAPASVTVKMGSTVSFVNDSSGSMWVASDPHPAHTILSTFDELKGVGKGETYEYTFTKVGTWTYHNHLSPRMKGTVIVTE